MRELLYGMLTCMGRRTITGALCSTGQQFEDWSSAYRLFEMSRVNMPGLWQVLLTQATREMDPGMPVIGVVDDTTMPKTGKKVHGTGWRRDAKGPRFQTNLIWAQQVVETALVLPKNGWASPGRAIAVDLVNVAKPSRPRKNATPRQVADYQRQRKAGSLGAIGAGCIKRLRENLDERPACRGRKLLISLDGGYTNRTVFRSITPNTALIGRVRADAAIFAAPASQRRTGRPRTYGERLPTPQQIKNDSDIPWVTVAAYAAGRIHHCAVKTVAPVRWKPAGGTDLRLLVIGELRYPRAGKPGLEHRGPAYLVCTDPDTPLDQLLQAYLWRWEVEVGFREQKTTMGMGQAQVRTEAAVPLVPAFVAMAYTILHIAAARAGIHQIGLPLPRWRQHRPPRRASTAQLLNHLRAELWGHALHHSFTGFANTIEQWRTPTNPASMLASAVLYANQ